MFLNYCRNVKYKFKIREFFENSKFHLALACYEEDIKSNAYLNHFIKINNLNLDKIAKAICCNP